MEDYTYTIDTKQETIENKSIKYSKKKLVLAGIIGAVVGMISYIIYENLDQETKDNFSKQIIHNLKNLINNILPGT
ncbi:MAG: hypothetical protein ABDH21_02180 [bacterium]